MELFQHSIPFPSSSSSSSSSHTFHPRYCGHFLPSFSDIFPQKMKLLLPGNPANPCRYRPIPKQARERLAMVVAMRSVEAPAMTPKLEPRNAMDTLLSFSTTTTRKPTESVNVDSITVLHRQLEKMQADIPFLAHGREWQEDYSAILVEKLKETRKQGMMLMSKKENRAGEMVGNDIDEAFYGVDPATLMPGEIVVHKARGVAKFVSTKNELTVGNDEPVEYVYLQYADGMAKLKSSQARRLLYRYFQPGEKGKPPTLSKLNDSRQWEKKKRKGRLAIQKMVRNLMLLYIQRLKQMRPPYPKNEALMAEFATKFPYHPTPDQEQAFFDVERDMTERETPMDRLVCGDVGFGKTEVALRAIFRVVCAGKQAMVLAPTTVLAKQHYEVIRERFAVFNYKVALLSRFQKTAEKKDVVKQIKDGTLNIVVGTHALLGKSIGYSNLGLLVVDEEHRFGVKQKERITSFKTSVDVLTLSATPIPRTLYLALSGFRDASLIATPPPERVPIQTHLCEYDESLIKSAIHFELSRGGQVFYVVPRIKTLAAKQETLEMLFPDNTIGVAHGKQSGNILEETFDKFSSGKIDILLCTNIIESGLDIQRVNTIVVEDVQLFGLAQLHQLRGRVGRADKESHAYLVYPDKDRLTDEAVERLVAIEECCGIGQGFKLAERDLLLRGFGSIFGEMQSGEVAHIGIDLFFEMLFDSLSKAEKSSLSQLRYKDVELDLEVETIIPSEYIANKSTRQILYQKLQEAASKGIRDLMQVTKELRSEYGKEPPSFELTLKAIYIKRMASNLGIYHIEPSGKTVIMETNMNKEDFEILMDSVALDSMQSSLSFQNGQIELQLLVELPAERMLEWIFIALMELHKGIPAFVM